MNDEELLEGGCLCGKIRYAVRGASVSKNICHCTQCRRQTGSALPAFVSYRLEQLSVLRGEPKTFRASPKAERKFCGDCGSPLFWLPDDRSGVDVFLGTLDAAETVARPEYAIWAVHAMPWLGELRDIKSYQRSRLEEPTSK
jgi:hypothetical protein